MRATMRLKSNLCAGAATLALAVMLAAVPARLHAQQSPNGIKMGDADLGGVVTGRTGPRRACG